MLISLYTIYDSKAGSYLPPFTSVNHATALRSFESAIQQEDHDFNRHAEDYSLWSLGDFDQDKAELKPTKLLCIGQAHEILSNLQRTQI